MKDVDSSASFHHQSFYNSPDGRRTGGAADDGNRRGPAEFEYYTPADMEIDERLSMMDTVQRINYFYDLSATR